MDWDIARLLNELEQIYCVVKNDAKAWRMEHAAVKIQLEALASLLKDRYHSPEAIARGGSGIIIKLKATRLHNQDRVLKFPRPDSTNAPEFARLLNHEIKLLASLRYRSLVVIHEAGEAPLPQKVADLNFVPYYIMDFVSGQNSDRYLQNSNVALESLLTLILDSFEAVEHLHEHNMAHLDIKPANIVVGEDGHPVLIDLGTTKEIGTSKDETSIATTLCYAPKELLRFISEKDDPSRGGGKISRHEIRLSWDLHALGLSVLEWIEAFHKSHPNELPLYHKKYLYLLGVRLLQDPYDDVKEEETGLPQRLLNDIRYHDITTAIQDVRKLQPGVDLVELVPELNENHHQSLQIAAGASATFTDRVSRTLEHPALKRLGEVSQLGLVRLVYPTATHTRLEHSLGTYQNATRYIRALYRDPLNPLFRQLTGPQDYSATLLAALVHDIGQFPLAHDLETIAPCMFNHRTLVRSLIVGFRDDGLEGTVQKEFPSWDQVLNDWDVSEKQLLSILETKQTDPEAGIVLRILKSIISGPIDADKLDYLIRDGRRLGVPYPEAIDMERLLKCLTVVLETDINNNVRAFVGVHEKALVPAEFVTMVRYAMFSQVYWHHCVRSAVAMLARAMGALFKSFRSEKEQNEFKSTWEKFVFYSLLKPSETDTGGQVLLFRNKPNGPTDKDLMRGVTGSALNAWDRASLQFLFQKMKDLKEAELIEDLLKRRLYKRVFTFNAGELSELSEARVSWKSFTEAWDQMDVVQRQHRVRLIEESLVDLVKVRRSDRRGKLRLSDDDINGLENRLNKELPILLVDLPDERPGSKMPLAYVKEEGRRQLRTPNRICGRIGYSRAWPEYAKNLRKHAGRIRVYAHPDFAHQLRAVLTHEWMVNALSVFISLESSPKKGKHTP
ncbi:MAG: Serine/threonine-protein kinase PknB [Deltaproteobacteria bacterium ADurb.Bin058]|nr:MAG: Serine/threonine-protein kinase PknB [Deltaproteobacteria bacterium ADurb.Bin058]HQL56167.1 protein kinase [Myxococcota bacterium]